MAPYLIDQTILLAALSNLKDAKKLQFSDAETLPAGESRKSPDEMAEDRHKAWFIFRRAELIGSRHSTFTATDLIPLVDAQFTKAQDYVTGKIGPTGPLNGFFEPGGQSSASAAQAFTSDSTHHLDLQNIAIWKKAAHPPPTGRRAFGGSDCGPYGPSSGTRRGSTTSSGTTAGTATR